MLNVPSASRHRGVYRGKIERVTYSVTPYIGHNDLLPRLGNDSKGRRRNKTIRDSIVQCQIALFDIAH